MAGAVPASVVHSYRSITGVDLGFVPLVRSPAATVVATALHARAYTREGVVHLPPYRPGATSGPDAAAEVHALLGHELAHVRQQRVLGDLPAEDSPLGELLESQAQAVERAMRGAETFADPVDELRERLGDELPEDLDIWLGTHESDTVTADAAPTAIRWTPETGFVSDPFSAGPARGERVQRAPLVPGTTAVSGAVAGVRAAYEAAVGGPPATPPSGGEPGEPNPLPGWFPGLLPEFPDTGVQPLRYPGDTPPPIEVRGGSPSAGTPDREWSEEELDRLLEVLSGRLVVPRPDLRDPDLLDQLAGPLYDRIRARLRDELLVDRERAGLLTEFH